MDTEDCIIICEIVREVAVNAKVLKRQTSRTLVKTFSRKLNENKGLVFLRIYGKSAQTGRNKNVILLIGKCHLGYITMELFPKLFPNYIFYLKKPLVGVITCLLMLHSLHVAVQSL